jgi:catechol 2,3-dioxygenase-like lactoylglutathione lyase family enzyme
MIQGIFHVNVNVTNFERSLEFYKMLGFKVALDLKEGGNEQLSTGLRIPGGIGRAALLIVGDDPRATRIDLIEWKNPKTEGRPYPNLYHAGVGRIALRTNNLPKVYAELKAKGVEFFSEPQTFENPGGRTSFVCCTDPDGTVIELIEV